MKRTLPVVCLAFALASGAAAQSRIIAGCPMFPANSYWYAPVDNLPVHPNSAAYVYTIGANAPLFPDFWNHTGGLFLNVVPASQPRVPVVVQYATEADPGPYPIPANAQVQQASDAHVLVLDQGNCKLYELWSAAVQPDGSWTAGSAAMYDLRSNVQRPRTWTSASAAGMPMMPGAVTYDEVMSGEIKHAIGMTVPQTLSWFIWPATHQASPLTGGQYPPMGQRFRLNANVDVSPYPFEVQVILKALKKYGAIIDDNGAPWFLNGLQDGRWIDNNLVQLKQVLGSNMEAVDTSSLMVSQYSGVVAGSPLALDSIYLDHREIPITDPMIGQVVLTAPAPVGGVTVSLISSNPNAATVPATVTVPAGAASAPFNVGFNSVALTTPVIITGSYNGVTTPSPQIFVPGTSGQSAPLLSALSISPTSTPGGSTISATITLTSPAPAGGAVVTFATSNGAVVAAPGSVTVPAGSFSAIVPLSTASPSAATSANVTATMNGESLTATVAVSPGGTQPPPTVPPPTVPPVASNGVRINAGGPGFTDANGNVWSADSAFSGGSTWSTSSVMAGPAPSPVYQTCRYGAFTYQIPVSNGSYNVTLKFAEISLGGPGQRQFNVAINGTSVLTNFDIFAQAGWLTAIDKTFPVTVANGQIAIQFSIGAANLPLISGIEITPSAGSSQFTPVRVNAAGPAYNSGVAWNADTGFTGGNTWATGSAIAGTATPSLYQTCRWGTFGYNFPAPNGSYLVTLKFAEITQNGPGRRQFNVALNGAQVLSNFDIFAQAGWLTAIDKSFPVTVTNGQIALQFTQGAADWPLVSAIEIVPAGGFTPIRINASGPTFTDAGGTSWSADTGFSGGNTWSTSSPIANTPASGLYQTCRWGVFGYNFSVPNGNYTVTLKFAEVTQNGPGRRQFNTSINGTQVLTNFDIFAQAGWLTAIDASFPVTVTNGQISIQFTQGAADWPLLSGIEITQ